MSSALAELTRIARLQQDLDDYWASARKGVPCLENSLKMLETLTLEKLLEPKTLTKEAVGGGVSRIRGDLSVGFLAAGRDGNPCRGTQRYTHALHSPFEAGAAEEKLKETAVDEAFQGAAGRKDIEVCLEDGCVRWNWMTRCLSWGSVP